MSLQQRTPYLERVIFAVGPRGHRVGRAAAKVYADRFRDPVCARAATDTYRTFLLRELPTAARYPEQRRAVEAIEGPVLVRDESGAALDSENERAWMAMLRRTAMLVNASRVLVVSHSAGLRALCDSVVWVQRGGRLTVAEPGWEPGAAP